VSRRAVWITGVGAIGPGFFDVSELDQFIMAGGIGCRPITRFPTEEFRTKLAFQVDQDRLAATGSAADNQLPLIVQYARRALAQALTTARLSPARTDPSWIFGTAVAAAWEMEACYGTLKRFVPGYLARERPRDAVHFARPAELTFAPYGGCAPTVVTTGCTAGLDALGTGWMHILDGQDCAVVVASEAPVGPMVITSFDQITALTAEQSRPHRASMPFSVQRSGFCIGEGAAALVLESAQHARRRGATPLGVLRGYATTSSAYHMTAIHSSGEAIARSLRAALHAAGTEPGDIGLLAPHATATQQNDRAEHAAFAEVFPHLAQLPLYTGKANFGHALGAANLIETVAALQILHHGVVPPHPRRHERRLEFPDLVLPAQPHPWASRAGAPRLAAKNSSGFSGIHSTIVLEGASCS